MAIIWTERSKLHRRIRDRAEPSRGARTTLAEITTEGRRKVTAATDKLNGKELETVQLSRTDLESLIRLLVKVRVEAGDFSSAGTKAWQAGAKNAGSRKTS